MKSEREIKMDYSKAKEQAKELDNIAESMRRLANRDIQDTLNQVSTAWTGEAANLYLKKGGDLRGDILKNAKKLEDVARVIRTVARRIYDADMRALELARKREYKK